MYFFIQAFINKIDERLLKKFGKGRNLFFSEQIFAFCGIIRTKFKEVNTWNKLLLKEQGKII